MVVYVFSLQADLEGIASITLKPQADLCLSVRNPLDHNEIREKIVIDRRGYEEDPNKPTADHSTSRSIKGVKQKNHHHHHHAETPCHFALKWKDATERSTIRVLDDSSNDAVKASKRHNKIQSHPVVMTEITSNDNGKSVPLLLLECDNIEPYAFHPMGNEFVVRTMTGKVFDTNLDWHNEADWSVYDLASGSTSITNLQATFE
jgi:hypothetical protein